MRSFFRVAIAAAALAITAPAFAGSFFPDVEGQYASDAVKNKDIAAKLSKEGKKVAKDYINVSGPVEKKGDILVIKGCVPHACTIAEGLILADTASGDVFTFWTDNGKNAVKSDAKGELPAAVKKIVDAWKGGLS
jgi:hypothetical protein